MPSAARAGRLRATRTLAFILAATLLAAGCGGGKGTNASIGGSNTTSGCAFVKNVHPGAGGRVYIEIAVSPRSLEQATCTAFDQSFGGRTISPNRLAEKGRPLCGFTKQSTAYKINLAVLSSTRATGHAFCLAFHPGHGFRRDYLR